MLMKGVLKNVQYYSNVTAILGEFFAGINNGATREIRAVCKTISDHILDFLLCVWLEE
jgi:hypothetical protein